MAPQPADPAGEGQAQRLERAAEAVAALLRAPDVAQRLSTAPSANDWSALQTLGHMVEMIPYWLAHCRTLMAATGDPPPFGRTLDAPERLAGIDRGAASSAGEMLRRLDAEVEAAASAIRRMSPADRARAGLHNRRGLMTVAEVVESLIVAHAEDHVAQVRAALSA